MTIRNGHLKHVTVQWWPRDGQIPRSVTFRGTRDWERWRDYLQMEYSDSATVDDTPF